MRHLFMAALALLLPASAQAAGIRDFKIPGDAQTPAITAMLWTPCATPPQAITIRAPLVIQGVRDCPLPIVPANSKLPLIVISHGFGGNVLGHHDTALALADAGFMVVSFNHVLDSGADMSHSSGLAPMAGRPGDVSRVISYMLHTQAANIDPERIGFWGFSRGGYTGLVLAGAVGTPPWHVRAIARASTWWFGDNAPTILAGADPRIKAFVIADPVNLFPGKESLEKVTAPIQLWASAEGGQGVTPASVTAIADALPRRPPFQIVPNSTHLSFLFPCSPEVKKVMAADLCTDPPGFDRAAFHRQLNETTVAFFRQNLR